MFSHRQDAGSQTEQIGRLFNFDGALTKREQIPNEMGLDWRVVELRPSCTDRAGLRSHLKSGN
ncbi:hypothetical protein DUA32_08010 [Salmonella enterica subsp. enterica serovar Bareilly]|nr:hypothetical protein [Salmonella enterica subsp. enterica serovar Hvittingfoss]EBL9395773.1 hypothetical protein [Salmonella enterica]EBS0520850.1 hypothetical protein [Salmonella enterica subsp. enterica serovar Bareilly]EBW7671755.1 hypothetical protein [Salmonella enterica subsp. enterica serovar Bareilly]